MTHILHTQLSRFLCGALALGACALSADALEIDNSQFPGFAKPDAVKETNVAPVSMNPETVEMAESPAKSPRNGVTTANGADPVWSPWEYNGKLTWSGMPTLKSFFGEESINDESEKEVYTRTLLNPDPALPNIPMEVKITNIFGGEMILDYDYYVKGYTVRAMELNYEIPASFKETVTLPDGHSWREKPYLFCRVSRYSDIGMYVPNRFFPESNEIKMGDLFLSFATDGDTREYGWTLTPIFSNPETVWEWKIVDFAGRHTYECNSFSLFTTYQNPIETWDCQVLADEHIKGIRVQIIPSEYYNSAGGERSDAHIKNYPDFPGKWPYQDVVLGSPILDYGAEYGEEYRGLYVYNLTINLSPKDHGELRIHLYPIAENGEVAASPTVYTYFRDGICGVGDSDSAVSGNWETLGEGTLQDKALTALRTDISDEDWNANTYDASGHLLIDTPTWPVTVERSLTNPGLYRVENAYLNVPGELMSLLGDKLVAQHGYLYFDATNPAKVILKPSLHGLIWDRSNSPLAQNYYLRQCIFDEETGEYRYYEQSDLYYGRLENNKIILPGFTVWHGTYRFRPENVGEGVHPMNEPDIVLTLPEEGGVEGVADDRQDAPAEYFNLQGIRVADPVKGAVYIVRRGNAVEKVRF